MLKLPEQLELDLPCAVSDAGRSDRPAIPSFAVQMLRLVVREPAAAFAGRVVKGSADVYLAFRALADHADREYFWTVLLDNRHAIIGTEEVSRGSLTASLVHPREVYKAAILSNAAALVLVHNHPSGSAQPSREDIEITRRLREAGELLGITVLDHVVIGRGQYTSFVDDGLW